MMGSDVVVIFFSSLVGIVLGILIGVALGYLLWGDHEHGN